MMFGRQNHRLYRSSYGGGSYGYPPYVSVAEKKQRNERAIATLRKKNPDIDPVIVTGRKLARNWWGIAWNNNLERYADYANRIDRGKSYLRSGSILNLQIHAGVVHALVQGSEKNPYQVDILVDSLKPADWDRLRAACGDRLSSMQTLLTGKFPEDLADVLTAKGKGLFPAPKEIHIHCSCPDYAVLCKHAAATLYGIGVRLDEAPSLFFTLRGQSMEELVKTAVQEQVDSIIHKAGTRSRRALTTFPTGLGDLAGAAGATSSTAGVAPVDAAEVAGGKNFEDSATSRSAKPSQSLSTLFGIDISAPVQQRTGRDVNARAPVQAVVPLQTVAPIQAAAAKKRGRPPKNPVIVAPNREMAAPIQATVPKKRGRPRKNPVIGAPIATVVAPVQAAAPKKRGRPRKNPAAMIVDRPVKVTPLTTMPKRRGRPKKTPY